MFGGGVYRDRTYNSIPEIKNGANDTKGQFYGKKYETGNASITIFHIENLYGFLGKLCVGLIYNYRAKYAVKMTPGNKDGLEGGYNLEDSSQYKELTELRVTGGYIKNMGLVPGCGMFPINYYQEGSASTYYCDENKFGTPYNTPLRFGGDCSGDYGNGVFSIDMSLRVDDTAWNICGVCLSYK